MNFRNPEMIKHVSTFICESTFGFLMRGNDFDKRKGLVQKEEGGCLEGGGGCFLWILV